METWFHPIVFRFLLGDRRHWILLRYFPHLRQLIQNYSSLESSFFHVSLKKKKSYAPISSIKVSNAIWSNIYTVSLAFKFSALQWYNIVFLRPNGLNINISGIQEWRVLGESRLRKWWSVYFTGLVLPPKTRFVVWMYSWTQLYSGYLYSSVARSTLYWFTCCLWPFWPQLHVVWWISDCIIFANGSGSESISFSGFYFDFGPLKYVS